MASLSLPRVLQLKKNSLDAEREHFEKFQTLAIQKAINSVETPVKEKHVRSTIIGTFQEQSAVTYWMVAIRLPLQDNRIVAWKFCHVTHKVLREGHPASLDDSQRHIGMIENLGKLWVHLREGYGKLIHLYCNLLVCKLKFHARNPRFPGNMQLTADELDNIAENDVNNYFQLCVELFDYMDDLLNLQAAVFDSLGNARANSMTASGQCRLAALIPCAQDSSHIYDCNVRLLFRLHASLPADTLAGHRERFRQQFKKLSQFYKHASSLQYYRNLLTLPVLPANPPNFLLQSDFGTYVAPVVSIPEQPPDETDAVGSLIDTSDTISQFSQATTPEFDVPDTRTTPSPQPDPVVERDRLIDHLQNELKRMRLEVSQMVQERNTMIGSMREHCTRLERQLQETKTELEEEKQKAELLSVQTPEIKQKLTETEEKAKLQDEKFQKLKGAYTQLREEHIALIRQKAEVDKLSANLRAAAAQHESAKVALQQQLNDRIKDVELLQQSASSSEEIEMYKNEIANLRTDLEQARQKEVELETLRASMETLQIEHKTTTAEQEEKLNTISNELKDVKESLEVIKKERDEKDSELSKVKEELVGLRESSGTEYKKVVEQKEAALKQLAEVTQQYQQEKEEQDNCIKTLHAELEVMQHKLNLSESNIKVECEKLNKVMTAKINELYDLLNAKDSEIKETKSLLESLETELNTARQTHEEYTMDKTKKVSELKTQLHESIQMNDANLLLIKKLEDENSKVTLTLSEITNEKHKLEEILLEKDKDISLMNDKVNNLLEKEHNKDAALILIKDAKNAEIDELKSNIVERENEITTLKVQLQEYIYKLKEIHRVDTNHLETISKLEQKVGQQNKEIEELHAKLNETISTLEKTSLDAELQRNEKEYNDKILNDKLRAITESKDEMISSLKTLVAEKDRQVISLNYEVNKLSAEVSKLEEEFKESQAELEIGKNELLALKEEHENIMHRNENNLSLKNRELRSLNDKVKRLSHEKSELETEIVKLKDEFASERKVLESKIMDLEDVYAEKTKELEIVQEEHNQTVNRFNIEIEELKTEFEVLKDSNDMEIKSLKDTLQSQEASLKKQIFRKDEIIKQNENRMEEIKSKLIEMELSNKKEKENMDNIIRVKYKEIQIMEARLSHTESERLNAECELQDLLQHNSVLETDLAAVRRQLEEARMELEKERSRLVTCAGEAALEVTTSAISTLDRSNAQESSKTAAEEATQALQRLGHMEVKGNEEAAARAAISAAHNAAAVSAYVIDVANVSTDMELSDKLTNECRTMLSATKQCLESLKAGTIQPSTCEEAQKHLQSVARAAAAADTKSSGARSVDDELADMDKAIEQAAKQIEEMLTTSRANDSGIKLEVNGNILDACTTLMGAVKVLVQDARRLQNELGDPKTRQKMYRRNPQWSEGLISAAKAVVFAAKLLVTSADEALAGNGRMEAVSAAAQEVAGSTAQLVAASRARAPPAAPALAALTGASRNVATATGAVVAAVRAATALQQDTEALDTSALTLTATRRLEMESKVRSLELETALEAERAKLAALRKRHYHLAQMEENGTMTNGKQ